MSWVSTTEAASLCECSERTVYRRAASGRLASRTDENGKLLVEVDGTHRAPGRQLSEVATALTTQLRITTDQHAATIDTLTTVGMRTERRLVVAEKAARRYAWAAVVAVVACLTGGGTGFVMLSDTHRDALDTIRDKNRDDLDAAGAAHRAKIATSDAAHRTEIIAMSADHADVVLTLERRAATSDGLAEGRAAELTRAAERLTAVAQERDESLTQVKHLEAQARGERPDGVPILLAAERK